MKKLFWISLFFIIGFLLMKHSPLKVVSIPVSPDSTFTPVVKAPRGDLRAFMDKMARIESDNNSRAVNRYGFLGKYQFRQQTLRELGMVVTDSQFLENVSLQDSAMILFMKDNQQSLRHVIHEYAGTIYSGIHITRSGILAAGHLVGPGGVLAFFYPNDSRWVKYPIKDGNGTTVEMYLEKFGHYNVNLD